MSRCSFHTSLTVLVLTIGAGGCGGYPTVTGRVTFSDGTPLSVGEVILDNGRNMGRGAIMPDGAFVIGFGKPGNGMPAGTYRVAIYNATKDGPRKLGGRPEVHRPQNLRHRLRSPAEEAERSHVRG